MRNLRQALEELGEPIEAVVVARYNGPHRRIPLEKHLKVVSWDEAKDWLDYTFPVDEYNALYNKKIHGFYAWTATKVIFVDSYDGKLSLHWVPRHPVDGVPSITGNTF